MTLTDLVLPHDHGEMAKRRTGSALGGRGRELTAMISIRLSESDLEQLNALSEAMPAFPPTTIARVAMRIGLAALDENPALALSQPVERRGGARKRKGKG